MKILYGVTGEGLGHAMRSRVVQDLLRRQGHELLVAASGRAVAYLEQHGHRVVPIEGFQLEYGEGRLRRARTLGRTLRRAPDALRRNLAAFAEHVDPFAPDLAITDFDSFAHAYGKRRGLPVISIDHHHVITRCTHGRAVKAHLPGGALLTRGLVRAKIPGCAFYIGSSFYQPPVLSRYAANTRIIGPVLRPEMLPLAPTRGEHVLVYQTSKDNRGLGDVLASAPGTPFLVYGFGQDEDRGHVQYRRFDEARFLADLASARAVITNGGHTVMAEALYLGKPLLSVPIRHQGEQEMNAAYLVALGAGLSARRLTPKALAAFLGWIEGEAGRAVPRVAAGNEALGGCLAEALAVAGRRA
jgi:uncharacterized protein (TIGR00661 family)